MFSDNRRVVLHEWHRILSRPRRWVVCAIAVAVLLAPGLHHHHHDDDDCAHQACYVCSQLARDIALPPAIVLLPSPSTTVVALSEARDETPRSFLPTTNRARGPPASIV